MSTVLETAAEPEGAVAETPSSRVAVLVIVEGINDIEFLRRISRTIHEDDTAAPDLAYLEDDGRLIFLPIGGSDHRLWTDRLVPLRTGEFHLYDRDVPPHTEEHQVAVDAVNRRKGCIAALTGFRHLENYLHPQAIYAARQIEVEFTGEDDLPELIARRNVDMASDGCRWLDIPPRKRRQMKHRVKRWLNTEAVDHMTPALLDQQDPQGDVRSWLEAIDWLVHEWS